MTSISDSRRKKIVAQHVSTRLSEYLAAIDSYDANRNALIYMFRFAGPTINCSSGNTINISIDIGAFRAKLHASKTKCANSFSHLHKQRFVAMVINCNIKCVFAVTDTSSKKIITWKIGDHFRQQLTVVDCKDLDRSPLAPCNT
ncbi:MAG: hypothetical protein BGP04_25010 [Rhizobiales bacterium 62-17]|nr:MAG: hypothetical protein BGP04_25010 [Rhizobiales bacterium 62-17]